MSLDLFSQDDPPIPPAQPQQQSPSQRDPSQTNTSSSIVTAATPAASGVDTTLAASGGVLNVNLSVAAVNSSAGTGNVVNVYHALITSHTFATQADYHYVNHSVRPNANVNPNVYPGYVNPNQHVNHAAINQNVYQYANQYCVPGSTGVMNGGFSQGSCNVPGLNLPLPVTAGNVNSAFNYVPGTSGFSQSNVDVIQRTFQSLSDGISNLSQLFGSFINSQQSPGIPGANVTNLPI